jgi:UPF0176 protein
MNKSVTFKGIHYKWSEVNGDVFPKLSVKVRDELVTFDAKDEVKVDDETGVIGGGTRLRPTEVQAFLDTHPDATFFDGRNLYESTVGYFKGAVKPEVNNAKEFVKEIESGKFDDIKSKPVITYCTGGIRCEILSVLMKNRGFEDVYQLDGGIVTYGKSFPKSDIWKGSCYVFDGRVLEQFSQDHETVGQCRSCGTTTENFGHCANEPCGAQLLICEDCVTPTRTIMCDACSS